MNKLREIEELLCIAVRALGGIPPTMKDVEGLNTSKNRHSIGNAIYDLMKIRQKIYALDPALTPKHMELYRNNETKYEELSCLVAKAFELEKCGDDQKAKETFKKLLALSNIDYFQHIAQAGLYRISEKNS